MNPPDGMKKPLRRGNGEGAADQAATKQLISDRSLPMDWFKISDAPGTDYTRVTVDVPHEQLTDVIDAIRACAPAIERPARRWETRRRASAETHGREAEGWRRAAAEMLPDARSRSGLGKVVPAAVGEVQEAALLDGIDHAGTAGFKFAGVEGRFRGVDEARLRGRAEEGVSVGPVGEALHDEHPCRELADGDHQGAEVERGDGIELEVAGLASDECGENGLGHEGSSSRRGRGVRESTLAAGVGTDTHEPTSEGMGGEGAAVISVALSVPRGGLAADMRWPAPHMTALPLCDLIAETAAGLRAALAEETEGGEAR